MKSPSRLLDLFKNASSAAAWKWRDFISLISLKAAMKMAEANRLSSTKERALYLTGLAADLAMKNEDHWRVAEAVIITARIMQLGEQYAESIELATQMLESIRGSGVLELEMVLLGILATSNSYLGNSRLAIEFEEQAIRQGYSIDSPRVHVRILELGQLLLNCGMFVEAIEALEKHCPHLSESDSQQGPLLANSLVFLGYAYRATQNEQALVTLENAARIAAKYNRQRILADALTGIALVHFDHQEWKKAHRAASECARIPRNGDMNARSMGNALLVLAALHARDGMSGDAEAKLREALAIAQRANDAQVAAVVTGRLGSLLYDAGRPEQAKALLRTAVRLDEELRVHVHPGDRYRVAFGERWDFEYEYLQDILLDHGEIEEAFEVSERGRGRALADLLSAIPGQDTAALRNDPWLTVKEIRQFSAATRTTFVEYSILPISGPPDRKDRIGFDLLIYVVRPDGRIKAIRSILSDEDDTSPVPCDTIPADRFTNVAEIAMRSIYAGHPKTHETDSSILSKMFKFLIQPVLEWLPSASDETVVFIPQLNFFSWPFAMLTDHKGRYLIERNTIMLASSIQSHIRIHQRIRARQGFDEMEALVIGDPTMPVPYEQLDFARQEALAIAKIYGVKPLIGSNATKSEVLARIEHCRILHFATHGGHNSQSVPVTPVFLVLAAGSQEHGFLTPKDVLTLHLQADLVVLSACYSGLGLVTNDGVIGLARAFLAAGAATVVVALAKVKDDSTSWLMQRFHRHYIRNGDKAAALRLAMLSTMRKFTTAADWGYFTVMGDRRRQKHDGPRFARQTS